jgi:hypothetical protein
MQDLAPVLNVGLGSAETLCTLEVASSPHVGHSNVNDPPHTILLSYLAPLLELLRHLVCLTALVFPDGPFEVQPIFMPIRVLITTGVGALVTRLTL